MPMRSTIFLTGAAVVLISSGWLVYGDAQRPANRAASHDAARHAFLDPDTGQLRPQRPSSGRH